MPDTTNPTNAPQLDETPPPVQAQTAPKLAFSINRFGLIAVVVIGIALVAGGVGGYILANQNGTSPASKPTSGQAVVTTTPTPTPVPSLTPTPNPTPTPTPDPTAGWKTYTQKDGAYSFKYPADWQLQEEFVRHPYDQANTRQYERLALSANGQEIVVVGYPFELIGCGQTVDKSYTFGSKPVVMTSDCGSDAYMAFFASPFQPGNNPTKQEPNLVVTYSYSAEHDAEFILLAKSFTGLKFLEE